MQEPLSIRVQALFDAVGQAALSGHGLAVTSPIDGSLLTELPVHDAAQVERCVQHAKTAQMQFRQLPRSKREALLAAFAQEIKIHQAHLGELITLEAGKTLLEGKAEAQGCADIFGKTMQDAALAGLSGMQRLKERPPAGVVGLITSFNFPLAVAGWTLAPALLAGNAVVWKPSEKTPLVALALKRIWDRIAGDYAGLVQVVIGGRETGEALVASEAIDMVSATGSVAMGQGIKRTLSGKQNRGLPPILELGGNNGIIFSQHTSPAHLEWSLDALMQSFLGTSGQRCTNTRRLIVHRSIIEDVWAGLQKRCAEFVSSGAIDSPLHENPNPFGYGPLIDGDGYARMRKALEGAAAEGARIWGGQRLLEAEYPGGYYVAPALALMPRQSTHMHHETFAPLLWLVHYDSEIEEALALINAPDNAGLVNGIYTLSRSEAERFAQGNEAGHGVVNSPRGTGTPAYGMGFGGNKASGEGEILNSADPLRAFTRPDHYTRTAIFEDVKLA